MLWHPSRIQGMKKAAGAGFTQRRESVDGLEMTFAVNYLAPFLLTNWLLDLLKSSAVARIINVAK
jgi:short-subunit dehydrogenase involved in D-alanine esterification of teichoic acids